MAAPSVALICVVSGPDTYRRYARKFFVTAADHFKPTRNIQFRILDGKEGPWPTGTMYRHHAIMEHAERGELDFDFLFMSDADMAMVGTVGAEILGDGVTATLHPGYVGMPNDLFPYERRPESSAMVLPGEGTQYYCGGFIGGQRDAFLRLSERVANGVDKDVAAGTWPCWHDESLANRYLIDNPPAVVLDPRYCCPADSSWYRSALWAEDYSADARIIALDKPASEREGR